MVSSRRNASPESLARIRAGDEVVDRRGAAPRNAQPRHRRNDESTNQQPDHNINRHPEVIQVKVISAPVARPTRAAAGTPRGAAGVPRGADVAMPKVAVVEEVARPAVDAPASPEAMENLKVEAEFAEGYTAPFCLGPARECFCCGSLCNRHHGCWYNCKQCCCDDLQVRSSDRPGGWRRSSSFADATRARGPTDPLADES